MDYGVCCEILTPRSVRSLKSHQYDFLNNLNKDDNKRHGNLDGGKAREASTLHKELQTTKEC